MATSADYQKLLNAVANYYGSGSDAWATIIKNLGTNDAGQVAKLLKSVPGVDVYVSDNGTVLDYAVKQSMDSFTSTDIIGSAIDSNNVSSTLGGSLSASIPSIIGKSTTTGTMSGIAGIGLKADTGLTATGVLSTVGVALGAVGIGAKLGKIVGDALYNSNPDIWDDGVISAFSQLDWGKFGTTLKDDVTGSLQRGILGLFGVDGDNTTMYLDENAVGYLTWYMNENGLLDKKLVEYKQPEDTTSLIAPNPPYPNPIKTGANKVTGYNVNGGSIAYEYSYNANGSISIGEYNTTFFPPNSSCDILFIDNKPNTVYIDDTPYELQPVSNGDLTYYGYSRNAPYSNRYVSYTVNNGNDTQLRYGSPQHLWDYAYLIFNGTKVETGGVDGISDNSNSTQFDPTGIGSVSSALGALKNQYPELWDNSIKKTVPQEDGSEQEHTYLPIPIPNFKNAFDNQPTTGTPDQKDPQVDPSTTPEENQKNLADTIVPPSTPSDNPNTGGGNTPTIIVPTQQASALWAIYNPTLSQLNSLGAWLWSTNFIDQILKIFNDPMQAIIGLHKVYASPNISGTGNIKVGYLDSGVPSNIVGNQYTYIDCGTVSLREYYGNILDYSPYTTVQLYLPFIGIVSLDIADVSRSSITVKYGVDVLTGACLASVSVQRDNAGGVLYQYSGNCACQYPLSSGSYMGMVTGAIGAIGSLARGNIIGTGLSIAGMHTNIEHSGGFSGNAGAMGIKKPYLIISRPQSVMNDGFPLIQGYPSNYFTRLGDCSGYTQIAECHVENIPATDKELDKIKDLLKEGVIL